MSYRFDRASGAPSSTRAHYRAAEKPTGITIHHWGRYGQTHDAVVDYLTRPGAGASAHAVVSGGRVTQLVDYLRAAWHSGSTVGNGTTIGLECRPEMTPEDWRTLVELCADLEEKYGTMRYFRHSDWKATACPGKYGSRIGELVNAVNAEHARRATSRGRMVDLAIRALKKAKPSPANAPKVRAALDALRSIKPFR